MNFETDNPFIEFIPMVFYERIDVRDIPSARSTIPAFKDRLQTGGNFFGPPLLSLYHPPTRTMAEFLRATKLCCQICNSLTTVFDPNIPDLPLPNLSHLLGINRALSNEEQTLAHDVAAEAGKGVAILDPQIDLLDKLSGVISKAHTELQVHRKKLDQIKVEHQRLASSGLIRQMMPEILSEIFLYHQSQFSTLPEFFDLDHHSLRLRDPSGLIANGTGLLQ